MNNTLALARPEIVALTPYAHAAWLPQHTRLHANEAPWRPAGGASAAGLNRYPEPQPRELIARLADLYGAPRAHVLATRGSDEGIDALSRVFLRPGEDAILQCSPTFGMYQLAARIQGAGITDVPLDRARNWALDAARVLETWRPHMKIVYLCSPNNPTANLLAREAIEAICSSLDGKAVIVIDEAYIEWSGDPGVSMWLERFSTLAVLRTLSKAHALAGARIGALLARQELIDLVRKVVPPYALSAPAVAAALRALVPAAQAQRARRVERLLLEREYLRRNLAATPGVEKVWPSDSNFLLIDLQDADRFIGRALGAGLLVRDMRAHAALPRSLRISVGTRAQNRALLESVACA